MRELRPAFLLLLTGALVAGGMAWPAPASLPPEAEKVARDFLFAFARNDRDAISALLPKGLADRYGPCPFTQMPALTKPRVDGSSGTINFEGPAARGLPGKGTLTMRRVTVDGAKTWRVRQIYWYERPPKEARTSEKSRTAADRKQEPALRAAAEEFLGAWLAGDFEGMDKRVFHWWERKRDAPKWVKLTSVDLKAPRESLGGVRVDFRASLKVLRTFSRRVDGTLWLIREDGTWRVRPLTVGFNF